MVKGFIRLISREIGGLHEAAYLLGFFAVVSQILALVRDRLLAHVFGATHALDIYYASFRIPDFIFVSIASIVSMSVLIPFFMERMDRGEHEAKKFVDAVFTMFFFIIGITALVAYLIAPALLKIFFPKFTDPADFHTLVLMTRIMLFSPVFLGFSNFLASITQIYKRFFIYALSPVVYNLGIIIGIAVFYPMFGLSGLAWGVALGAFLHCMIQIPFLLATPLFPTFTLRAHFSSVKKVMLVSLPRTITVSSNEIAEFFLVSLASVLAGGAISVFNFSWNLQSVPLSIIGVSYSIAAFPALTKLYTSGDEKRFAEQMATSTKHIVFWSLPVMTMFIVIRAQIVRVILGSGNFNWADTRLTAAALALFTISLIPQSLTLLFVRAYYSRGDTKKPLLMNIISAGLIILFSYMLVRFYESSLVFKHLLATTLRVDDVGDTSVLMLPLGFSLGAIANMIMHWVAFEYDFPGYTKKISRSVSETLIASIVMGVVSYFALNILSNFFSMNTVIGVFAQGFLAGIIGIFVGTALLVFTKNKELLDIAQTLKHKIWRPGIIPPDPSV